MHIFEMKNRFLKFMKDFDKEDFDKLMEFLEFILYEYREMPVRIFGMFNFIFF